MFLQNKILFHSLTLIAIAMKTSADIERNRYSFDENGFYNKNSDKLLSRKKRYLVFPEGSSLQLGKKMLYFAWNVFLKPFFVFVFSVRSNYWHRGFY